jgi:hypothetical protein
MILKKRWVDNYKCCRWWEKLIFMSFCGRRKKSTVRDFLTPILTKTIEKWLIAIYGKTAPTKSTVLGPGPPPGNFIEFIEIYGFLAFLGLQYSRYNRHQSRHLRPTPPRKEPKSVKKSKFSIKTDFKEKL